MSPERDDEAQPRQTKSTGPGAAGDAESIHQTEGGQRCSQRGKDTGQLASQLQCKPAAADRDNESYAVGAQRPQQPSAALPTKIKPHAEAEEAIKRPDRLQVIRARLEHGGIGVEQRKPGPREGGGTEADHL